MLKWVTEKACGFLAAGDAEARQTGCAQWLIVSFLEHGAWELSGSTFPQSTYLDCLVCFVRVPLIPTTEGTFLTYGK